MVSINIKGNTITVATNDHGKVEYTVKKIRGLVTYSVIREDGSILIGGRLNKADCVEWIKEYYGIK